MGRRRRRHDADWAPLALMGLAALMGLFRGRRAPAFARDVASPLKPVLTLVALVGAFIALSVLLTVLSAVAALGGGGVLAVGCGFPVLFIAFIAWWAGQRAKQSKPATGSDPWTIDGSATTTQQTTEQATEARTSIAPLETLSGREQATWLPSFARPRADTSQQRKPAAKVQPAPERPPRSPAEYRQHAASYRRKIQSLVKMRRPGPIAARMTDVLQKLKSWEERVGQLADRLTLYEKDDLIQRDVREAPVHIDRLRRQLALEADPDMQRQVRRTLGAYEEQQRQLGLLARVMKRTRLNLDDTLAAMGTVYSQLQVLNAMDLDGPTAARIAGDVDREVERLSDLLAAMSDVYGQSGATPQQASPADDADTGGGLPGRKARLGGSATG